MTTTHECEARELIDTLARLGVRLAPEGEQLVVRAPRGALTPELRERLAEHKPRLLALLRQAPDTSLSAARSELVPAPSARHEPFPLTDIQQAYWIGRAGSLELGSVGCHAYWEIDAIAADVGRLERAWRRLVERHDMLRAVFLPSGVQRVLESVPPFTIDVIDLRGRSAASTQAELGALRERMSHHVYAPDEWPLFDLRAALLDEPLTRLFFSFDLLVLDAASILQVLAELKHLYKEPEAALPDLELSFRDYVLGEAGLRAGAEYERAQAYWRARAGRLAPAPDLPRVAQAAGRSPRFVRRMEHLEPDRWARLKERAQHAGLTPSGALCAAWAEVLALWSASSRFTLTLTLFRRLPLHRQVDQIVGDFTSTVLLEFDPPEGSFEARARRLQERLAQDLDHSLVSGVQVIRERARLLGAEAEGFPVVFTSTLGHRGSGDVGVSPVAWLGELVHAVSQTPQVTLDLQASDYGGGLQLALDAPEELFPPGFVDDLFEAYRLFVRRLSDDAAAWQVGPERALAPSAATRALQARANATDAPLEQGLLHEPFLARAAQAPDAVAVVCPTRRLTYGELAWASRRLGRRLRQAGARPNTFVAVVMDKGWEQVAAVLGVLESGAAYLPIEPTLPAERLRYLLEHAQVEQALTVSALDASLAWPAAVQRLCVDERILADPEPEALERVQEPDDLAYLIYTSGSTGTPKGVMIDHRAALNTVLDVNRRFDVAPSDRVLALSSLSFDLSVYDIFGLLAAGGTIVLPDGARRHDTAHWSELVATQGVTLWNSVPTLMELWVEAREKAQPAPMPLRLVLLSGDWIPVTLPDRIRALAGSDGSPAAPARPAKVIGMGGATEASIWSILYPIEHVHPHWKSIPYGRAMANQSFHVLSDDLRERPVWVPGTLYIGGVGLARGYWRDDEKTRASFIVHPGSGERLYRTGDMGRWLPDGTIEFLGRQDGQVKVGGHRIELGEIEATLLRHPAVQQAVVLVRQETGGGRRLVGFVVPAPDAAAAGLGAALREHLFARLPDYMVPSTLTLLEALPVTANAKVDRKRLLALAVPAEATPPAALPAPQTVGERRLVALAAEALGRPSIGPFDNFFEHGCTSLDLVRLVNRVRETWGHEVKLSELFRQPTLAALCARLEGRPQPTSGTAPVAPPPPTAPARGPASASQEQLWFTERLRPGSTAYHVHAGLRLRGRLNLEAMCAAYGDVVRRHQSLRTRLHDVDGRPEWSVLPAGEAAPLRVVRIDGLAGEAREDEARRRARAHARTPFELDGDVLFRAELLWFDGDDSLLLITQHHIVTDGWSVGVFARDLLDAYTARAAGRAPAWAPLPVEYGALVERQRAWLAGEAAEREREWWRARLAGMPPLELPFRRTLAGLPGERGESCPFHLSAALTEELSELARREGTTLFSVLFAAYAALLQRHSGATDFGIGTVTANRAASERADVMGYFANTLVLRCDLRGDPTFSQWLARAGMQAVEALEHEELPFFELTRLAGRERGPGLNPLVEACFAFENVPLPSLELPGLAVQPMLETPDAGVVGHAKFDLTLIIAPAPDGLAADLQFAGDLFDAGVVERLVEHYRALLGAAVRRPQARLSELDLLPPRERRQVLVEWSGVATACPREATLAQLFEQQVRVRPEATALACGTQRLSYAELDARAERLARHLAGRGVAPDVPVGVCLERSVDMIVALVGVLKAGGAYLPLDPGLPRERLGLLLEDAAPPVVITRGAHAVAVLPRGAAWLDLDAPWDDEVGASLPAGALRADHLAYVMYTSGTTGMPKGVRVPQRAVVRLVSRTDYAALGPESVLLQFAPLSFDASTFEIWGALLNGGRLVIVPGADASLEDLGAIVRREGVTTLWLTAGLFHALVEHRLDDLVGVRELLAGGDVLSPGHVRRALEGLPGCRVINGYGPTENTTFTCCHALSRAEEVGAAVPIGRPIPNTRVYVLDACLEPLPAGVPGELYAGGDGLARDYLGRPDLTARSFVPDPFSAAPGARLYRTGDIVRWRADGALEFLGRHDTQVKIHGFRVEPAEIEAVLGTHPALAAAAVVALEDLRGDKRLVAYVVPRAGDAPSEAELRGFLARRLSAVMVPSAYVVLEALPLTPNGKVDRRALPPPESLRPSAAHADDAPRTPVEEILASTWAELLGLPRVGIRQDFFALGGHSLLAMQVVSRVRRTLGVELPVRALFEAPSVAALAERLALEQGGRAPAPPIERVAREHALELSFAQQRLWFLDQLKPGSAVYNIPCPLRLDGPLDVGALERALGEIVRRHEVLRTTFAAPHGAPRQVISDETCLALERLDLEALEPGAREAEVQRLTQAEARRPFDLGKGPLLRVLLVRLAPESHVLMLTMHHIVSDAWSLGVLGRELGALYAALRAGRRSPLSELELQYADFAHWQRRRLEGELVETQLAYWKQRLEGAPFTLDLPADRPRPLAQSERGALEPLRLAPATVEALEGFARAAGATPFMLLLAAFVALVARYTGQTDIVVGSPVAGRDRTELEGLIGFFVNTLALRTDLSGDPSFRVLVERVREATLSSYAHQEVPFELLVETLQPQRDASRSPLFQVMFALQNTPVGAVPLEGLNVRPLLVDTGTSKFDLSLLLFGGPDGFTGVIEYSTDLFDRARIVRLAGHLQVLLEAALREPDTPLSRLPLLTEDERLQARNVWHATSRPFDTSGCPHELFERQARLAPDAPAVECGRQRLSYAELNARANRLARELRGRGVAREVLVAVCMERSVDLLVAFLAVLKAGGVYLPLDPSYPPERLAYMLADARAGLIVTRASLRDRLPAAACMHLFVEPGWSGSARGDSTDLGLDVHRLQSAYVIYTSGSTGRPKGAVIEQRGMLNHLQVKITELGLSAADVMAETAPQCFDISIWQFLAPLLVGGSVHVFDDAVVRDPLLLLDQTDARGITVLEIVPSMLRLLLDESERRGAGRPPLARLRWMVATGEELPIELARRWPAQYPRVPMINAYGPTECSDDVTHEVIERAPEPGVARVLIGRALANLRLHVLDRGLEPLPVGVPGELYVGGVGVGRGYLNNPARTAEIYVPDPFTDDVGARMYKTGDLVRRLLDGSLDFAGRVDFQVKVRGYRIELGDIESALAGHAGVGACVVVVREDVPGDRRLVAYVVPRAGQELTPPELRGFLKERVPESMLPAVFVVLPELPLTPNGKIDRRALPAPEADPGEPRGDAPRTPLEEILVAVWADVLGRPRVGIHANFFDLGGHSLLATQAVSRLRRALGAEVPLRLVFEAPTVAALAERLEQHQPARVATPPLVRRTSREAPELSFAQQRLWFLDQLQPGSALYNVPCPLRLEGPLDVAALERTLNEIVRRHEALRTTVVASGGRARQRVAAPAELPVELVDLQPLAPREREAEAQRLLDQDARAPFDLERGPLVRARLLRLGPESHVLLLSMHHIVSDGWSLGVLGRELEALYAAFRAGRPSPLRELDVQYADFAVWQREWLAGDPLDEQRAYWRGRLEGVTPLELPADRPRPAVETHRGGVVRFGLARATLDALEGLARREGATLFMVLLAAFKTLLWRYTGQADVVVGTPIAGRNRGETESLIGLFINTLALRTDLSGDPPFRDLVARVREVTLGAYAHQDAPFEWLVEELQPQRDLSRTPLFQVVFALQTGLFDELRLEGLRVQPLPVDTGTAKFDLTLNMGTGDDGAWGVLEYNGDLFERERVTRLVEHLRALLAAVAEDAGRRLSELPLLGEDERRLVVEAWNPARVATVRGCLHELFADQAARTPDAIALVCEDQRLTYAELEQRANRLARHLRAQGVQPDELVGLFVERSLEMVVGLVGILKAGAAYLPLDPAYPRERLAFMLEDARARVVLSQQCLLDLLPSGRADVLCLDRDAARLDAQVGDPLESVNTPAQLAYVIYTSGSTGRPKGVMVTHADVARLFSATEEWFHFDARDVWSLFHSHAFDFSVWELWGGLLYGGRVVIVPYWVSRSPEAFYELLVREGVTMLSQTPSAFRQLAQVEQARGVADGLRLREVVFGGEALELAGLRGWWARHDEHSPRLVNMYGITETTVHVTYQPLAEEHAAQTASLIGRAIPDLRVYVLDGRLHPLPVGVPGELCVGGAGLARGYLRRPALTAERFVPDPFGADGGRLYRSGDLGRWRADGTLEYMGRIDQQVKVRGFRIELGEIEAALAAHPDVAACVVVAREDESGDRRLVAYVVPRVPRVAAASELRRFLSTSLPDYMVPALYVALAALPLTPHGKIDRRALPVPEGERPDLAAEYVAPRGDVERRLAAIWAEVLGLERVGAHDNFFDLGGDSILSLQVRAQARAQGLELSLQQLFQYPTVALLARAPGLAERAPASAAPRAPFSLIGDDDRRLMPQEIEDAYPVSLLQAGMLFHGEYDPQTPVYHNVAAYHLRAPLDLACLEAAVRALVRRHPVLRTSFDALGFSEPLQLVHRHVEPTLEVHDVTHLPQAEQGAALAAWIEAEKARRFDPARPCLARFGVRRRSAESWDFTLVEHHAILDGWSVAALLTELFQCYFADLARQPSGVQAPATSFGDFVALERGELTSDEAQAYWRRRLEGVSPAPLPWPAPEGPVAARAAALEVPLPDGVHAGLRELARAAGVALKSVLLAAHLRVVSLACGRADVVTGLVSNGRPEEADAERVLGLFLNTLPLRLELSGGTWRELVARAAAAEAELLPFRRYPLARLQQTCAGRALFDTVFNFTHFHVYKSLQQLHDLELIDGAGYSTTNFPLIADFALDLQHGGLQLRLEYDAAVLDARRVQALAAYYQRALTAMAARPDERYEQAELLPEPERRRVLVEWNDTARDYPAAACVHEIFAQQARRTPAAAAVTFADVTLDYRALDAQTNRLARHLRAQGVGPEVRVGVCAERSLELVTGLLAVLKAGGAYVPLDPDYPRERLRLMLADAGVQVLLLQEPLEPRLPADLLEGVVRVGFEQAAAQVAQQPAEPLDVRVSPDGLAYVMYTSGSTGRPKGVAVTHRGIVRLVQGAEYVSLGPSEVVLQLAPISFDASTFEIWGALLCGGRLAVMPPGIPSLDEIAAALRRERVSVLWLTAALFHLMVDEHADELRQVRQVLAGGDALSPAHVERYLARLGAQGVLVNGYGPTEGTTFTCCHGLEAGERVRQRVPIGRPIANTRVYVLDGHGRPCPPGTPGEAYVGGAGLARGYWGAPQLTAERFVPDPFGEPGSRLYRTGDLVRHLCDGSLDFLGRIDRQVKVHGFRIEPAEIEAVLASQADVAAVVVSVREDAPGDKRLVAYVVPRRGRACSGAQLRARLAEQLPEHMCPAHFVMLEELPLTPSGKVDRGALPAPAAVSGAAGRDAGEPPCTPLEELLASLWAEVLGLERVGRHQDFFALGGHSLLATQLVARLRRTLGVEVPLRALFDAPTVAGLARGLAQHSDAPTPPPIAPVARTRPLELSFAQQRLWFLDRLQPGSAVYNVPCAFELTGPLDPDALQRALDEVVRRHEALRTVFSTVDGRARQVVGEPSCVPIAHVELESHPQDAAQLAAAEARSPFDLANGPLLRARLLRLEARRHVLLLTLHHIVSDGWSMGVLARELWTLYTALREGRPSPLPEPAVQYADFAHWQREWLSTEVLETQLTFWRGYLGEGAASLELPADHPRPGVWSGRGASVPIALPRATGEALAALGRREGATLFMVLLAGFYALLSRYTGRSELIVGTPIAGRRLLEIEGLIGFFVNTLPLRVDLSGDPRFGELLRRVRAVTLDAYAHQDVPFEWLVERLQPQRDSGRTPLVQVMFALQDMPFASLHLDELSVRGFEVDTATAKFDLTLVLHAGEDGLTGALEYATDLFERARIVRLAEHLQVLLQAAARHPEERLSRLPLMAEAERRSVLVEWNATATEPAPPVGLHELFEAQVARAPQAPALLSADSVWSYAELDRRADRIARHLGDLGIGFDARVGVCARRRPELLAAILGVLKAGAAYVPIDPGYPRERQLFMLEDAGVSALLADPELLVPLAGDAWRALDLTDACARGDATRMERPAAVTRLAYVIYTSGSTGRPKGVGIDHRGVVNLARDAARRFGVGSGDVVLQFASAGFDASVWEWTTALTSGAALLLPRQEDVRDLAAFTRLLESRGVSVALLPPSFLAQLDPRRLACVRTLLVGGEACPPALARRWATGRRLFNAYGPTEASVYVTLHPCADVPADTLPIGRPIDNVTAYVLDARQEPVPVGIAGELYAGGAGVARGYLGRPDLTAERFVPDPFGGEPGARLYRTGDTARRLPDGSLEFLGRIDQQVKLRGFRVELGEIETLLAEHPDVAAAAVVVREDAPGDLRLHACIVPRSPAAPPSDAELRGFLKQRLPEHMLPAAFLLLEALPMTAHGKVDRGALAGAGHARAEQAGVEVAPRTPLEHALAAVWAEVLGLERVGVRQSFFDLGGHSLLAPWLFARIEQQLGCRFPLATLYRFPTVETFAQAITAGMPSSSLLVPFEPAGDGPMFFCVHAAGGAASVYRSLAEHLRPDVRFYGLQAVGFADDEQPQRSIEEMAECYVAAVRQVQPRGPYHLGGWSFGGLVAFEMALRLVEAGESVATLVLIDTPAAGSVPRPQTDPRVYIAFCARLAGVAMSEAELAGFELDQALAHTARAMAEATPAFGDHDDVVRYLRRIVELAELALDATYRYQPRPYAGELTLLNAAEVSGDVAALGARDPTYGWGALVTGRITIERVPGDHETLVREPHARALALALRRRWV